MVVFLAVHVFSCGHRTFTALKLVSRLLFAASLGVHIATNMKPLFMTFGFRKTGRRLSFVLGAAFAALAAFAQAAFVTYFKAGGSGKNTSNMSTTDAANRLPAGTSVPRG